MDGKTDAFLVWDGGEEVRIPPALGEPRSDQMQGTVRERLCELAGRTCYDAMGKGRSSGDYWRHILEVGHLSIFEHAAFTYEVSDDDGWYAPALLNRPGVFVRSDGRDDVVRITANLRHAIEWSPESGIGRDVRAAAVSLAPSVVLPPEPSQSEARVQLVEPETDHEKWVTLFLVGSRGFSLELVRHGDWTAISQRSTRYVDESESPWVMHPLLRAYLDAHDHKGVPPTYGCIGTARTAYDDTVRNLQSWLLARGVDKVTARKQARGAARGFLGNALQTEVVFSANIAQWRHMMRMRCSAAADAEIREVFCKALACLKVSRYGDRFADMELVSAPDGIGECLAGGGAR